MRVYYNLFIFFLFFIIFQFFFVYADAFLIGNIRIENPTSRVFVNYTIPLIITYNFSIFINLTEYCKNLIFYSPIQGYLRYTIESCDNNKIFVYLEVKKLLNFSSDEILIFILDNENFSSYVQPEEIFLFYSDFTKMNYEYFLEKWYVFSGTEVIFNLSYYGLNISVKKCKPPIDDVGMIVSKKKILPQYKEIMSIIKIDSERTGRISNGFAEANGTLSPLNLTKNLRWYWDIPLIYGGACNGRGCAFGVIVGDKDYHNINNSNLPSKFFISKFRVSNNSITLLINEDKIFTFTSYEISEISRKELNIIGFYHWCESWASIEKIIIREYYEEEENLKIYFIPKFRPLIYSTSLVQHLSFKTPIILEIYLQSPFINSFLNKYKIDIINFTKGFEEMSSKLTKNIFVSNENIPLGIFLSGLYNSRINLLEKDKKVEIGDENIIINSLEDFYKIIFENKTLKYRCFTISNFLFLELSALSSRYAFLYDCFPIFLNTSNPFEIKTIIKQTYDKLRSLNLLSTLEPEIVIIGDFSKVPSYPIKITEDLIIYSDYPYADLNDDKFQDLPIRRLCCSLEEISLQIEAKKLANLTKNALIVQTYLDIINESDIKEFFFKGGFMPFIAEIRDKLKYNKYNVERLTEKRLTNENIQELIEIFKEIISTNEEISFSEAIKFLKNLFQFSNLISRLLFEIETNPIRVLETLTLSNFLKYLDNTSILFIITLTEKEKYILPTNKTYREEVNISNLQFIEIVFDASLNNFENSLPYLKAFTKLGYKNHTNLISSAHALDIFSKILDYNFTLSKSLKEARNSKISEFFGITPAHLIYIFSEEYKKYSEDWLNSIIFIGETFQIINKSKKEYYNYLIHSNPKIKLVFKDICSIVNLKINNTNYTTFVCNYTDVYTLNMYNNISLLYILQEKINLPQFKSLKNYSINYSIIEINEYFPLTNISKFYDIVLVNNSNDIQDIYINLYPARFINNKTILLKDFEIEIKYDNSFEIRNLYSQNTNLYIEIFSDFPRNVSIEILKNNFTVLKDVKEVFGFSRISYKLEEGNYLVKIKYFEIEYEKEINITKPKFIFEIPIIQRIISSSNFILKIFENYFKKEKEFINSSIKIYSLETPIFELKIENLNIYFRGIDFEYQKINSFSEEIEKLKTPYGYLEIKIKDGNYYEFFEGNCEKLKEKLYKVKNDLKNFLENIKNNS
ncbi:MAG: hypothetical protein QXO40_02635 [Candidatus Aenigmatarchaeota archaeon]